MNTALTRSDIRTMARKAADYITFHCDGISEGFEITHKGYIAFIDYEAKECSDDMQESVTVPAVLGRRRQRVSRYIRNLAIDVELII